MKVNEYIKKYKTQKRNKGAFFQTRKLIPSNVKKLHNAIKDDHQFWQEFYFTKEDIIGRTYTPYSLQSISPKTDRLIAQISKYFNCIVIWDRVMIPGTSEGLETISVYGYPLSCKLCYYFISKTLSSLDYLKYNIKQWKRKDRRKKNRRGYKKRPEHLSATQLGQRYYDITLNRTIEAWEAINKERSRDHLRLYEIYKYVDRKRGLNYRMYHYKEEPLMMNAFSTPGKFQIKRIIYDTH